MPHAATAVADPVARSGAVRGFLRLVVIEHSVFALPFVYLGALTAMRESSRGIEWNTLLLVTVAMVAARTFAMAANRVIDREMDARNPRTASRELVTGVLAVRTAVIGMIVALVLFLGSAALLSPLCLLLAPLAVAPLIVYPYGKRFTWLCHAILGLAQAVAPVGAWIAVTGEWSWTAVLLGLAVGTWIGSFDLIYACQDVESDRREGVYSLPARFGVASALRVSGAVHLLTVLLLIAFGVAAHLGAWWALGVAGTTLALMYEHSIVSAEDLSRVNRAFFTVNGYVGIGLLAFGLADLLPELL